MAILKSSHAGWRKLLYLFLGTAVTIVLLSWVLQNVSLPGVWISLRQAYWQWLLLAWVAYLAVYWVRAWRWGTLLGASGNPGRFRSRLMATFVGFGAGSVLPAYAGEVIRAATLGKLEPISLETTAATLLVERLLDVGVVLLLLLVPIGLGAVPTHSVLDGLPVGWIGGGVVLLWALLLVGALIPAAIAPLVGQFSRMIGLSRWQSRIELGILTFLAGLSALRQPRRCAIALGQTLLSWLVNAITFWAAMVAFGITAPGFLGALFTQSLTGLAIALPSTPGYVGPFEAGIRLSLTPYAVPVDTVIAYAVALRFVMYVSIPLIAGIIAIASGLIKPQNLFHKPAPKA